MKKHTIPVILLVAVALSHASAQITLPSPSPSATVTQEIGLLKASVDYSRPSMRGRKIFGELLPYGELWRTGANQATKVSFSQGVTVEGKKIPAGDYSLFTIPNASEWTVILNKNAKASTNDYKQAEDAARFTVKPGKTSSSYETLTIEFANLTTNSAQLTIKWETTKVAVKLETDVDAQVMAQIEENVTNGTNVDKNAYFQAAVYYLETDRNPKQALEWVNKATATDPQFWQLHQKAKIQAKLKDYKNAIATAEKSIELAKAAKNNDYVRLNEKVIAEWKAM